ncbi:MAG: flippase [Candidatus Moranbacteria bacterium]|nr:flippase [Candidatus Moranbacteria bacterium]MDD3964620.1 flippase [Candidatus Moranbacteria bacterium]
MALARKIAYNVVLNSFLKVFSTVALSLYSIRLITGYLGQDGFGKYSTVLAFFAFFSAIADLGLSSVTAREISREGADEKNILSKVLSLRLTTSLTVFLLAPLLIVFLQYENDLKTGILIAAGAILFSTTSLFMNGIFQKRLAMDKVALIEFLGKVFQVSLVFFVVQADLGFLAVTSTLLASLSFNAIIVFLLSRRFIRFSPKIDVVFWKNFLRESLPMGATAIITFTYFKIDTILLSLLQSNADVGIYNVAYKVMENLIFFPAMLVGLILPLLSRFIYTKRKHFEEIANKTFKVFFIIVVPIVVGTWFLSDDIIRIVSGEGFMESAPVLRILIFSLACIFFGNFFNMLLIVGNAQKKLMQTLFFVALFNICLNFFLIPRFSYHGAAFSSLATEMLVVLVTSFLVYKHVQYRPSFENIGKILLSGMSMSFILLFLSPYSFFLAGFSGVATYLIMLWLTRAITAKEVMNLFQKGEKNDFSSIEKGETITL